jgi:hypothetical protein
MSPTEILVILALTGYAIYKQTTVSEVKAEGRFKMAIIYAIVGLCVGGFVAPKTGLAIGAIAVSLVLSVIVGLARGHLTKVWVEADGRVMSQGTALTVSLFLGLIAAKFAIGTFEYFEQVPSGGFGEVMLMIAVMVAFQAEIVYRRDQRDFPQ